MPVKQEAPMYHGHSRSANFAKKCAAIAFLMLAVWLVFKARNEAKQYDYIGKPLESYTISVSGEGKVVGIPDVAAIDLGMTVERPKVADAQRENTRVMNALIAELNSRGIDKKDIQTTGYSVYPVYDWTNNRQILRGYTVTQNVHVKIRQLDSVGEILGRAGELGLNQVGGVTFTVDEPKELEQEARIEALRNAKEKAEALARVAGVKLGRVVNFQESFGGPIYPPMYAEKAVGMGGDASVPAPRVEAGSTEVTATVTITYQIE